MMSRIISTKLSGAISRGNITVRHPFHTPLFPPNQTTSHHHTTQSNLVRSPHNIPITSPSSHLSFSQSHISTTSCPFRTIQHFTTPIASLATLSTIRHLNILTAPVNYNPLVFGVIGARLAHKSSITKREPEKTKEEIPPPTPQPTDSVPSEPPGQPKKAPVLPPKPWPFAIRVALRIFAILLESAASTVQSTLTTVHPVVSPYLPEVVDKQVEKSITSITPAARSFPTKMWWYIHAFPKEMYQALYALPREMDRVLIKAFPREFNRVVFHAFPLEMYRALYELPENLEQMGSMAYAVSSKLWSLYSHYCLYLPLKVFYTVIWYQTYPIHQLPWKYKKWARNTYRFTTGMVRGSLNSILGLGVASTKVIFAIPSFISTVVDSALHPITFSQSVISSIRMKLKAARHALRRQQKIWRFYTYPTFIKPLVRRLKKELKKLIAFHKRAAPVVYPWFADIYRDFIEPHMDTMKNIIYSAFVGVYNIITSTKTSILGLFGRMGLEERKEKLVGKGNEIIDTSAELIEQMKEKCDQTLQTLEPYRPLYQRFARVFRTGVKGTLNAIISAFCWASQTFTTLTSPEYRKWYDYMFFAGLQACHDGIVVIRDFTIHTLPNAISTGVSSAITGIHNLIINTLYALIGNFYSNMYTPVYLNYIKPQIIIPLKQALQSAYKTIFHDLSVLYESYFGFNGSLIHISKRFRNTIKLTNTAWKLLAIAAIFVLPYPYLTQIPDPTMWNTTIAIFEPCALAVFHFIISSYTYCGFLAARYALVYTNAEYWLKFFVFHLFKLFYSLHIIAPVKALLHNIVNAIHRKVRRTFQYIANYRFPRPPKWSITISIGWVVPLYKFIRGIFGFVLEFFRAIFAILFSVLPQTINKAYTAAVFVFTEAERLFRSIFHQIWSRVYYFSFSFPWMIFKFIFVKIRSFLPLPSRDRSPVSYKGLRR